MNGIRLFAVARKELLQIWRDPRSLMLALLMPITQILLLGYGVTLDIKHLPLCAWDREASQRSEMLLKDFAASQYFDVVRLLSDYGTLKRSIDDGTCKLALVVPPDLSLRLNRGEDAPVQLILDATDDNTASVAAGYAEAVVQRYSTQIELEAGYAQGRAALAQVFTIQPRVWFNEELESKNFVIPGLVASILALVGAQLSSLTVAREWERGTMEVLISTPVTRWELLIGKLIPYFGIGMLDAGLCVGFALFWFDVPFRGTLLTLFATTALFLTVVLSLGYLISAAIRSQIGASQIALVVTMLPTTLLSGYIFPIDQMPKAIQAVTYLVHARYFVTIIKGVFLKGLTIPQLIAPIASLALYAAIVGFFAMRSFRKSLD